MSPISIRREFGSAKEAKKLCKILAENGVVTGQEAAAGREKGLSVSENLADKGASAQGQPADFTEDEAQGPFGREI